MCSMSSWIQAANAPRSRLIAAIDTIRARSRGKASGTGVSGAIEPSTQASPTTAKTAGLQAISRGRPISGAESATRAAQT